VRPPVLDIPTDTPASDAVASLKAALGHVTPLVDLCIVTANGRTLVAAGGAGTTVNDGTAVVDLSEASIDEARLIAHGNGGGGTATLQAYDSTGSRVLCAATLPSASGLAIGAWTQVPPASGDRTIQLKVIGDAVKTQTLNSVRLQLRTVKFQP